MKFCLVFVCKNKGKIEGVRYFKLTKRRFASWAPALHRDPKESLSETNVVCSDHFGREDFEMKGNKLVLKDDAVPSYNLGGSRNKSSAAKSLRPLFTSDPLATTIESTTSLPVAVPSSEFPLEVIITEEVSMQDEQEEEVEMSLDPLASSVLRNGAQMQDTQSQKRQAECPTPSPSSSSDSQDLEQSAKRRRKCVRMMHNYSLPPRKLKTSCEILKIQQHSFKRQRKVADQRTQRLKCKVHHLDDVTQALRKQQLMSDNALFCLEKSYSDIPLDTMKRLLTAASHEELSRTQYPEELRSFAMTLQLYSTRAYEYVRRTFRIALPSHAIIRQWLSNEDCTPGFSTPAFSALQAKATAQESDNDENGLLCSFMLDEMQIRKQVDFIASKTWGYEDLGTGTADDDELNCATEALVFMVVSCKANWKLPIGFFLFYSLTAAEKANIVKQALVKLHEVHVRVTSVTCGGLTVHLAMATELGARINDLDNLQPFFLHPHTGSPVFVIFDNCHMLNLLRIFWAVTRQFRDPNGDVVDYKYVDRLYELQQQKGLQFGTKVRKINTEWQKQKMKVKLEVQVFSKSIADAMEFLQQDVGHPDFVGAGPTIRFIRLMDQVFDLLNSRNPAAIGSKSPLHPRTENTWRPLLESAITYFKECKNMQGAYMHSTNFKGTFRGYIITITSLLQMYDYYIKKEQPMLKYLLTYKFNQDHLELFFWSIRARSRSNNPTAFQFHHAYKRLLVHHHIRTLTRNCTAQDSTTVLVRARDLATPLGENRVTIDDMSIIKKYNIDISNPSLRDRDYQVPLDLPLTTLTESVVGFMSGFVVRLVKKQLKCFTCMLELETHENSSMDDSCLFLIRRRNLGGLIRPSADVVNILKIVETQIRKIMSLMDNKLPPDFSFVTVLTQTLALKIFSELNVFPQLQQHCFDYTIYEDSHIKKLINALVSTYLRIRFFSLAKYTKIQRGDLIKRQLSNYILFLNR